MGNPYILPEGNVQIGLSGGRTSAFMLRQIMLANGDLPDRNPGMFFGTEGALCQGNDGECTA